MYEIVLEYLISSLPIIILSSELSRITSSDEGTALGLRPGISDGARLGIILGHAVVTFVGHRDRIGKPLVSDENKLGTTGGHALGRVEMKVTS